MYGYRGMKVEEDKEEDECNEEIKVVFIGGKRV